MALGRIRLASNDPRKRMAAVWPLGVAVLVAVLIALFLWGWTRGADARILAGLPPDERARLFQLTWNEAGALCAEPRLEERCRAEVKYLADFPECTGECQQFVAQHRPSGSR